MKHILKCLVVVTFFSFCSKINAISNIRVGKETIVPMFNEYITKYNVFVSEDTNDVNVSVDMTEEDDYVTGVGNINLEDGKNQVTLKVIKKNSEIINYDVTIFKNYKENNDSEIATLEELTIDGYDIKFDKNIFNYEININNEERLQINYVLTNDNSIVKISGNSNFKIGNNIIKILVKSSNGENTNVYTLKINKVVEVFEEEKEKKVEQKKATKTELTKNEIKFITIVIISIGVVIIIFTFYLLFMLPKKNK